MPRSPATKGENTESFDWYDSIPSMSDAFSPASAIAAFTAKVAIDRVVWVEPRLYSVSPTPTIAYLSRRNFGVEAWTVSGIGMRRPPFVFWLGAILRARPRQCKRMAVMPLRQPNPSAVVPAKAGTQYAAVFAIESSTLWNTGSPL